MMHRLIVIIFSSVLVVHAHAQRVFVEVHGTYQMPIGGSTATRENWEDVNDSTRIGHISRVNLNWGTGPGIGVVVGCTMNEHIGVELRSTYFPGTRTEYTTTAGVSTEDYGLLMRYLRLEPTLRIRMGDSTWNWYVAMGPSFAVLGQSTYTDEQLLEFPGMEASHNSFESETTGGVGLGGFGAVGVAFHPKGRLGFFGEINCTAQSWSPQRSERTKYVHNNVDKLGSLSTHDLITHYVDDYIIASPGDPDSPAEYLRFHNPMSSWGLRIGVSYAF